jgi:acetyl esterase/lipase
MSLPPAGTSVAASVQELGCRWGYETIDGVPPEFARRVYHWVEMCGADAADLLDAFRSVPAGVAPLSEGWAEHFTALGNAEWTAGRPLDSLLRYEIAMFALPFTDPRPFQRAAYELHTARYLEAAADFDPPLEVVRIASGVGDVIGHLRVPAGSPRPPAVLITGGADGWKSHRSLHATQDAFLAAGWATLAVDLPGTGQNPNPLDPGCHRTLAPIVRWLRNHERVDGEQVAAHMRSFGGYFAVALATESSREELGAIVAVAPPVHHAFHRPPPWLGARSEWFTTLSLLDQSVLRANPSQPDLLVVHSLGDPLCPIEDTYLCAEHGIVMDSLIYAQDYHTAMLNGSEHLRFSVDWLGKRVRGRRISQAPDIATGGFCT